MPYDPDRVVKQLGRRIAQLRRERGMSQADLALRLKFTPTPQWVSQLERGTRSPTLDTLCKVADALEVTLADLVTFPPSRAS